MPAISVWFVRTALLHFALGATAGAWRLVAMNGGLHPSIFSLRPLHVEGMLIGWLCQFALGVAVWILPFSDQVSADWRLWSAWAALNGGLAISILGPWMRLPSLLMFGRSAELLAGALAAWVLWPRVRGIPVHS